MENTTDDNTQDIAYQIFTKPPLPKNSIQLGLEDETANIAEREGVDQFIFEILTVILMHGVEILFGHRNVLRLSENDFMLLQQYTNSFGYQIIKKNTEKKIFISFQKIY